MSNTRKLDKDPVDLDALIAETNNEPYTFKLGGKDRTLPHIKNLNYDQAMAVERNAVEALPEITDDEDLVAQIRKIPAFALEQLVNRWFAHAGIDLGESQASLRS